MKLRVPHYFEQFKCIASACKDNCCYGGWQIDIDDDTAEYYKSVEGEFGDRLREAMDYTDAYCFKLKNKVCPFLDKNNLCEIYGELGEEHMGMVCAQFPRFSEYFGNVKETGIGLACEEAARIILNDDRRFELVEKELEEDEYYEEDYDETFANKLFDLRSRFMSIMDDSTLPLKTKLKTIIVETAQTQDEISNNDSMEDVRVEFNIEFVDEIWGSYEEMETLSDEWTGVLDDISKLHTDGYFDVIKRFNDEQYAYTFYDKIAKYYLYRYFMKSAYDYNLFGKVQFLISNLIVLKDMDLLCYLSNGRFTYEDRMRNIHLFSRQVEYSLDNIDILNDEFMFGDTFSKERLISVVDSIF